MAGAESRNQRLQGRNLGRCGNQERVAALVPASWAAPASVVGASIRLRRIAPYEPVRRTGVQPSAPLHGTVPERVEEIRTSPVEALAAGRATRLVPASYPRQQPPVGISAGSSEAKVAEETSGGSSSGGV